ncbi:hypothetical protein ACFFX0_10465 [Citricoccus parietis]|uniref:Uncharacterized protein n=1 Tax=Citricoccus parietis TaxID=592307 RepID=A0ABV5FY56_9MICC
MPITSARRRRRPSRAPDTFAWVPAGAPAGEPVDSVWVRVAVTVRGPSAGGRCG